ncbi:unnamed protein product [Ilex paraguariensis]|uniref:Uncharacterized protein n=2 Tax=Ilex paraguariensis TaxID=185542 RepID=A0ABC8TSV1_9AQUA
MEDDLDLDLWNLCAEAGAFFEILELLDSNDSKIGAVAEKIDNIRNTALSSVRFSGRSKIVDRLIKDYKNCKNHYETGLKIQQTLEKVYDSSTNKVRRLMRLGSIHCDVKMIKAIGFILETLEDDLDLNIWNLCVEAEAFFKILELLDSNGSNIGAVARKIDDIRNTALPSVRFSGRSKRVNCLIKDYKNYKDHFETGLKIQQTLDEVYDSLTNKVKRLMRLRSIHCDVNMIKAIGFILETLEDNLDLDLWNLCAEAEAFFEILELLNSIGSKIGAVAEKIDDMRNIVLSSVRFSDPSKRVDRLIKDYKNYKDHFETGLKIQQILDEVYDSLMNRVKRLMRLRSIHYDVKMIKAIGFFSQLFGYT